MVDICTCGHSIGQHQIEVPFPMCKPCYIATAGGIYSPGWHLFKPDNLVYLEILEKQKNG